MQRSFAARLAVVAAVFFPRLHKHVSGSEGKIFNISIHWFAGFPWSPRMCNAGFPDFSGRSQPSVSGWLDNSRFLQVSMRGVFVRLGILARFSVSICWFYWMRRGCRIKKGCWGYGWERNIKALYFGRKLNGAMAMVDSDTHLPRKGSWLDFPNCKSYYLKCSQNGQWTWAMNV